MFFKPMRAVKEQLLPGGNAMDTRARYAYMLIFSLSLLLIVSAPVLAAETYQLDPVHSSVVFRVKHLGVAYVYGRFNNPAGQLVFDEKMPSNSSIDMSVNVADVDTAHGKRDTHLKSPDFFNAESFPRITFKSGSFKKTGIDTYAVSGDLTLLGVTRPLTVVARQTGAGKDPWGGFRRGFATSFSVNRSDFGMDFMLSGVSNEVEVQVSVEAVRK
jgi:polyisoprenoid-binding protein YceI